VGRQGLRKSKHCDQLRQKPVRNMLTRRRARIEC
jgi:hypothetical protein